MDQMQGFELPVIRYYDNIVEESCSREFMNSVDRDTRLFNAMRDDQVERRTRELAALIGHEPPFDKEHEDVWYGGVRIVPSEAFVCGA